MFTPNSFRRPSKVDLEFMEGWRVRWNPHCERKNIGEVRIVKERQDNFSLCVLEYPCKTRTLYFTGIAKRNANLDEEDSEIGWNIALSRACRGLFAKMVVPPKKKPEKLVETPVEQYMAQVKDKLKKQPAKEDTCGKIEKLNQEFFDMNKDTLVAQFEGKYALVHDYDISIYDKESEAAHTGYAEFGLDPFVVQYLGEKVVTILDAEVQEEVVKPVELKGEIPVAEDHLTVNMGE